MVIPDTRHSLLLRLTDAADAAASDEFADLYEPLETPLSRTSDQTQGLHPVRGASP